MKSQTKNNRDVLIYRLKQYFISLLNKKSHKVTQINSMIKYYSPRENKTNNILKGILEIYTVYFLLFDSTDRQIPFQNVFLSLYYT